MGGCISFGHFGRRKMGEVGNRVRHRGQDYRPKLRGPAINYQQPHSSALLHARRLGQWVRL